MSEARRTLSEAGQEIRDGSKASVRDAAGHVSIKFQLGPVQEVGVNGTTIEKVISLLIARLEGFQRGPFACRENHQAIACLYMAVDWLEQGTRARQAAGVEGTNQPH